MTSVKRPTLEQMKEIVTSLHLSMSEHEIAEYLEVMEGTLQAYWPEANVLLTRRYDPVSAEPDYNAVVTVERS